MAYLVIDGFETNWSGTHADNYTNMSYKYTPSQSPATKMTQTTDYVHSGSYATKLQITSTGQYPGASFWGAVLRSFNHNAMKKEYNPWVSVWYYDKPASGSAFPAGYLSVIPNTPVPFADERADIQLGTLWNRSDYYYHTTGNTPPTRPYGGSTGVARSEGWHQFKVALTEAGGADYFVDGTKVASSHRSDYLGVGYIGLGSFCPDNDGTSSTVYYDDLSFGSDYIPEPMSMILLGLGILGLVSRKRRK